MARALYDNPIALDRELYKDGYITTRASKSGEETWLLIDNKRYTCKELSNEKAK